MASKIQEKIPLKPETKILLEIRYVVLGIFKVNKHLIVTPLII